MPVKVQYLSLGTWKDFKKGKPFSEPEAEAIIKQLKRKMKKTNKVSIEVAKEERREEPHIKILYKFRIAPVVKKSNEKEWEPAVIIVNKNPDNDKPMYELQKDVNL